MEMVLSSWTSYNVSILFDWWHVQTVLQFLLSCGAIIVMVVAYHLCKMVTSMKISLDGVNANPNSNSLGRNTLPYAAVDNPVSGSTYDTFDLSLHRDDNGHTSVLERGNDCSGDSAAFAAEEAMVRFSGTKTASGADSTMDTIVSNKSYNPRPAKSRLLLGRALHALLGSTAYGLAMLCMLVAMTYNPWLLMALCIGSVVGDYFFGGVFRGSGFYENEKMRTREASVDIVDSDNRQKDGNCEEDVCAKERDQRHGTEPVAVAMNAVITEK